jgi:hypothetical protein
VRVALHCSRRVDRGFFRRVKSEVSILEFFYLEGVAV